MKLTTKMIWVGVLSVASTGVLFFMMNMEQRMVSNANADASLRDQQTTILRDFQHSQIQLLLAAMDSIIDKGEGRIDDERLAQIEETSDFIINTIPTIRELADTDEEIKDANLLSEA